MTIYGPVQLDCMYSYWQVLGKRGGVLATFYTKKEAKQFVKDNS